MKYLTAEKQQTQYYFLVHMDETEILEDGTPDPAYVREFVWGLQPLERQSESEYIDMMKREIPLLVEDTLTRMNPQPASEPIPLEGF